MSSRKVFFGIMLITGIAGSASAFDLTGSDTCFDITTSLINGYPDCGQGPCLCDPDCNVACPCDTQVNHCDAGPADPDAVCFCDPDCYGAGNHFGACTCDATVGSCDSDNIRYAGGGSSTGEKSMSNLMTEIAPMSKFLKSGGSPSPACTVPSPEAAEGIAFALDGIAVVRSARTFDPGPTTGDGCDSIATSNRQIVVEELNGVDGLQCPGCDGNGVYTLSADSNGWKEILALAYGGKHKDGTVDCNSDVRWALAGSPETFPDVGREADPWTPGTTENWENWFENEGAACNDERCGAVWHIYRRGDMSGTTDTFKSLLGIKSFCNGTEYQDNDPIRRPCFRNGDGSQQEDVCSKAGDLGWLLPIVLPPAYVDNPVPCRKGAFGWMNANFQTRPKCIDGSNSIFGRCLTPKDANGNYGCLVQESNNFAMFTPLTTDTRAFNLELRNPAGAVIKDEQEKEVQNAYFRLHALHTTNAYSSTCKETSSTKQIGCLVTASACSLGFAGMEAAEMADSMALEVANVNNSIPNLCDFSYKLTRYLYLNTAVGFDNITDPKQADLAGCFHDVNKIVPAVEDAGFVPLTACGNPDGIQGFVGCP